jgi:hypothetical protein
MGQPFYVKGGNLIQLGEREINDLQVIYTNSIDVANKLE